MLNHTESLDGILDIHLAKEVINAANDGVTITDMTKPDQPLIFINTAFEKMTGYKLSEVIGKNCRFLQGDLKKQPETYTIREAIKNKKNCRVVLKNVKKDGTFFWNELSLAPIFDVNGNVLYYVGIQKDVTNDILQKERISYLSLHDDLTGLYNYRGFFAKINDLLVTAEKNNLMIAIGIADIDYFKLINDHYGHIRGNNILKIISSELIQEFSTDEHTIISRFGGDEFCFAMIANDTDTQFFYDKISNVVKATNFAISNSLQISISSGVAIEKASKNTRIDLLIHQADDIMYENKQLAHMSDLKNKNGDNN